MNKKTMEKFNSIYAEYTAVNLSIKEIEEKIDVLPYSEKKVSALCSDLSALKIKSRILHENMRIAYANAVLPVVIEEFSKYDGKPYGEKTKEKIRAAVVSRVNCSVYASQKSYAMDYEFSLVPLNENGFNSHVFSYGDFEFSGEYDREKQERYSIIDKNHKINVSAFQHYYMTSCGKYTENVEQCVSDIMEKHVAALEAIKAAEKAVSEYNDLIPSNIERMYISVKNDRLPH